MIFNKKSLSNELFRVEKIPDRTCHFSDYVTGIVWSETRIRGPLSGFFFSIFSIYSRRRVSVYSTCARVESI